MYYEEKVIDGVLCCRGAPDGEFTPLSAEELTDKLLRACEILASIDMSEFQYKLSND